MSDDIEELRKDVERLFQLCTGLQQQIDALKPKTTSDIVDECEFVFYQDIQLLKGAGKLTAEQIAQRLGIEPTHTNLIKLGRALARHQVRKGRNQKGRYYWF
jgi:hypothetical protein